MTLEKDPIRKIYERMERQVLILIALMIPAFAIAYLYSQSPMGSLDIAELPPFWDSLLSGIVISLLIFQQVTFNRNMAKTAEETQDLEIRLTKYAQGSTTRFWILLLVGLGCAIGLVIFDSAVYTLVFAIALVVSSLAKPSPERIVRVLRLKGEEKETIMGLKRRV